MPGTPTHLRGGGRFTLTVSDGAVVKRGDAVALAREAAGLRRVAGLDLAPRLIASHRGAIVTELLPGGPRQLDTLAADEARALGSAVRRLHDSRHGASGGLARWPSRVRSLAAYRRRRIGDAVAMSGGERRFAHRVIGRLAPMSVPSDPLPFRMLHGDLVGANVVWGPAPRFVDLEFWRMGDPAEDLAYLIEIDALPESLVQPVVDGYADRSVTDRIDAWRALCLLDAGLWHRGVGQPERAEELLDRAARCAGVSRRPASRPSSDGRPSRDRPRSPRA